MMTLRVAAILLCLLLTPSAFADLTTAKDAIDSGDYANALAELQPLADGNDPEAQYQLGMLYRQGRGVRADAKTAVDWFRRAADQGNRDAQYALGQMHLAGEGVFKDDVWAITWFRKAAQQGHEQARRDLNAIYVENGLEPPDWSEFDREATADAVDPDAPEQWQALETPETAQGQEDDEAKALALAREHGIEVTYEAEPEAESEPSSEADVSHEVIAGEEVYARQEQSETRQAEVSDAAVASEAASEPEQDKSKKGLFGFIGGIFDDDEQSQDVTAATTEPTTTMEPAAEPVYVAPQETRAPPVARAPMVPDYETPIAVLGQRANDGDSEAQTQLAMRYQTGRGVEIDPAEAARWYERAARQGDADAQFNLGNMYLLGEGVSADDNQAVAWYRKAADQGHEAAQQNLESMERALVVSTQASVPRVVSERELDSEIPVTPEPAPYEEEVLDTSTVVSALPEEEAPQSAMQDAEEPLAEVEEEELPRQVVQEEEPPASAPAAPAMLDDERGEARAVSRVAERSSVDLSDAEAAFETGDYGSAFNAYQRHADAGDPEAQFRLARLYEQGYGVKQDEEWAITWYRKAATGGHSGAAQRLDDIYADLGIEQPPLIVAVAATAAPEAQMDSVVSEPEAAIAFAGDETEVLTVDDAGVQETAADSGEPVLEDLAPIPEEDLEIAEWDEDAAAGSDVSTEATVSDEPAETDVAEASQTTPETYGSYEDTAPAPADAGAPKRPGRIAGFFGRLFGRESATEAAADAGTSAAAAGAGAAGAGAELAATGADIAVSDADAGVEMTATLDDEPAETAVVADDSVASEVYEAAEIRDLAAAKAAVLSGNMEKAASIFLELAEDGDAEAQANIGYMYYVGEGVRRDPFEAVHWYLQAAGQENVDAQYNLAVAYAFGDGVVQDDAEAARWYRRAADQGHSVAQYSLAISYALGEGVPQSEDSAVRWYREAANNGYAAAQYNLAYMYRTGKGVEQDNTEALGWYRAAAEQGHAAAQYNLGYMYRTGKGAQRDTTEAIKWYKLAAEQGYTEARTDLETLMGGAAATR